MPGPPIDLPLLRQLCQSQEVQQGDTYIFETRGCMRPSLLWDGILLECFFFTPSKVLDPLRLGLALGEPQPGQTATGQQQPMSDSSMERRIQGIENGNKDMKEQLAALRLDLLSRLTTPNGAVVSQPAPRREAHAPQLPPVASPAGTAAAVAGVSGVASLAAPIDPLDDPFDVDAHAKGPAPPPPVPAADTAWDDAVFDGL
jgi:hypothetical protein